MNSSYVFVTVTYPRGLIFFGKVNFRDLGMKICRYLTLYVKSDEHLSGIINSQIVIFGASDLFAVIFVG